MNPQRSKSHKSTQNDEKPTNKMKWKLLEREMLHSNQWAEMSRKARCMMLWPLDLLEFEKGSSKPKNGGVVCLEIEELAQKESLSQEEAREAVREIVKAGFFRRIADHDDPRIVLLQVSEVWERQSDQS